MKYLSLILFISLNTTIFAQQNIDLFIWAGQSNALGMQGDAAQYPDDPDNLDNQILINWTVPNGGNSNGWVTMGAQDIGHYFPSGHFGPEVTFSRKLLQAGYNPAIFKFTQGATSIFQHWLNPGEGGLYDDMIFALNTAITDLQNQGYTITIRGFVWIQGESDSNSDDAANAYFTNLTTLLNDFRNNAVNIPNLPVILGVDEQFFNLPGYERHQILNAHQDIALNDNSIKFTSMYGYPKADDTHLTPEGLIAHGEDLFDSFQLLISGKHPSSYCYLSSIGNHTSFLRSAWGQSFTTDCSGILSNITFEAVTQISSSATFTLYNGADCSGTVLATKTLNSIEIGNNIIDLTNETLYLDKEHTYYFDIVSDNGDTWEINFSDVNNVFGVLRCTADNDVTATCGRTFLDYDMDFSVTLDENTSCNIYSSGNEISFERTSWGQSFVPICSNYLKSVTFSAASNLNTPSTFTLYDGDNCNAAILGSKSINTITTGNNIVTLDNPVHLYAGNTYYFQIASNDTNTTWQINYNNTDVVSGLLTCTSDDGLNNCGRNFPSYDMNFSLNIGESSCENITNIYTFNYNGKTYEVVKDTKNWEDAAACATERGGELARINDADEQSAVWNELNNNANIDLSSTVASNGGDASYVWIGGNDLTTEGTWIWDGNNDGIGDQFWSGDTNGNTVGGLYSNWGNEPDNADNQDCLAIALTQWPLNTGTLGSPGQWNDLKADNLLCYVIEYPTILDIEEVSNYNIKLYPNPVNNILFITNDKSIRRIVILNSTGQILNNFEVYNEDKPIHLNFSKIKSGLYFIKIILDNGQTITKKVIK